MKRKQSQSVRNRIVFYAFLSEHDALKKWKENSKKSIKFFSRHPAYNYIYCAFTWEGTIEGWSYWSNLNILWKEKVKEM